VKVPNDGSVKVEELACPYKFDAVQERKLHLTRSTDIASVALP